MNIRTMLDIVGSEPVFETGLLLAGNVEPAYVRQQLSRWVNRGYVFKLRRGLYAVAPPFQKKNPHPFLVANRMMRGSYVSCWSALAHYGLIPEYVQVVTSVTTGWPAQWDTPLGRYEFRRIKPDLWGTCELTQLTDGQQAFVATPEKALLDLLYLFPRSESTEFIQELRLQNLNRLETNTLMAMAEASRSTKLENAARQVMELAESESVEYEPLVD